MRFSWVCGYRVTFFCPRSMCWDEWVDILVERCIYRGGLGPMTRVRQRMRPTPCLEESTNKNGRWMVACISFIILEESLWKVVILESFFMFFFAGSSLSRNFQKSYVLCPMVCLRRLRGRVHLPIFKRGCYLLHSLEGCVPSRPFAFSFTFCLVRLTTWKVKRKNWKMKMKKRNDKIMGVTLLSEEN